MAAEAKTRPEVAHQADTKKDAPDRKKRALSSSTEVELRHALDVRRLQALSQCTEDEIEAELESRTGGNRR